LVECGLDQARHDRMLDVTGGDTAALAEITTALDTLSEQESPDLLAMTRLAIYRGAMHRRNDLIPPELPVAWAVLGHRARAEALASMMLGPRVRDRVQQALAGRYKPETLWWGSQPERYMRTDPRNGPYPADVQDTIAAGDLARAGELALAIKVPHWRYESLRQVVRAMAPHDAVGAEQLAREIGSPRHLATLLTELIVPVADAGDRSKAEQLATEAEALAHTATAGNRGIDRGVVRFAEIIAAMVEAGDVADAERVARALPAGEQEEALIALATAVAETGDLAEAETLAATISRPAGLSKALTGIVRVDPNVATRAADMIRAVPPSRLQDRLWGGLVVALAHSDDAAARSLLPEIQDELIQLETLVKLVRVLAADDRIEHARDVAASIADRGWRDNAMTAVAEAIARVGDGAGAAAIAETLRRPQWQARTFAAAGLTARAEAVVAAIDDDDQRAQAAAEIVVVYASRGDIGRGLAVADTIPVKDYWDQARALRAIVAALVRTGERDRAREMAGRIADSQVRWVVKIELALADDSAGGRRVIARVLRGGGWLAVLPVLAKIEPTMMPAICADLF
jgi:hypothetical protein